MLVDMVLDIRHCLFLGGKLSSKEELGVVRSLSGGAEALSRGWDREPED